MSLNGKFVIDCVTHGFDFRPQVVTEEGGSGHYAQRVMEDQFKFQWDLIPDPYRLSRERYFQEMSAEVLASALFVESDTDVAFYHTIPLWGIFHDISPIKVGMEIRDRYPGRMFLYGAASPLEGKKAADDVARQVDEWGNIDAVKLYPVEIIDGKLRPSVLDDRKVLYPFLEKCQELGIRTIAIHKALPFGTSPMDPFHPKDVDYAARDFPNMNFEIVHGGFAFLEETSRQVARFANVYVNLEVTAQLIPKRPRQFARILGELILWGGSKKIFWGTGCTFTHPAPLLEAFEAFQMPDDLVEGYDYPLLTKEMKADILANNFARLHQLDINAVREQIKDDELAKRRQSGETKPWSLVPEPAGV